MLEECQNTSKPAKMPTTIIPNPMDTFRAEFFFFSGGGLKLAPLHMS
jgi:hypothetical protein